MRALFNCLVFALLAVASYQANYSPTLARELLRASSASYCSQQSLKAFNCGNVCKDLTSFGNTFHRQFNVDLTKKESLSYSIFINKAQKKVHFAFRGTQGSSQLVKEIVQGRAVSYNLHNIKNAVATEYFYVKYKNNLRNDVLSQVRSLNSQYSGFQFYFTGHSLGGALATLAALDVSLSGALPKSRIHLYTFGAPRVGDYNLANAVNNNVAESYRVVHRKDIVPHVPPCVTDLHGGCTANPNHPNQNGFLIWNAYHVGTEVFYNNDANTASYQVCSSPEDPKCSKGYKFFQLSTGDHGTYLGLSTSCS